MFSFSWRHLGRVDNSQTTTLISQWGLISLMLVNGIPYNCWLPIFFEIPPFVFSRRQKFIQVGITWGRVNDSRIKNLGWTIPLNWLTPSSVPWLLKRANSQLFSIAPIVNQLLITCYILTCYSLLHQATVLDKSTLWLAVVVALQLSLEILFSYNC